MYDEIKLKSLSLYVMAYLIGCFYPAGAHVWIFAINSQENERRLKNGKG